MNVTELIEELKKHDPEKTVVIQRYESGYPDGYIDVRRVFDLDKEEGRQLKAVQIW